jgi:hypothetical protein
MRHRGRRALPGRRRNSPPGRRRWRRGVALAFLLALGTSVGITCVAVTAGELSRRLAEYTREGSSEVAGSRVPAEPSRSSPGATGRAAGHDPATRPPNLRRAPQPSPATDSGSTTAPPVATETEQPAARTSALAGDPSTADPPSSQGSIEEPQEDGAATEQSGTPTSEPRPDDDSTPGQGQGPGPDGEPPSHDPDQEERPGNGQGQGAGQRPSG